MTNIFLMLTKCDFRVCCICRSFILRAALVDQGAWYISQRSSTSATHTTLPEYQNMPLSLFSCTRCAPCCTSRCLTSMSCRRSTRYCGTMILVSANASTHSAFFMAFCIFIAPVQAYDLCTVGRFARAHLTDYPEFPVLSYLENVLAQQSPWYVALNLAICSLVGEFGLVGSGTSSSRCVPIVAGSVYSTPQFPPSLSD